MSRRYFLTLFVACATRLDAQVRHEFSELHMGVEVRMVVFAPDTARARSAARAAFVRVAELEEIMSDYRPKSELRRLEQQAGEWSVRCACHRLCEAGDPGRFGRAAAVLGSGVRHVVDHSINTSGCPAATVCPSAQRRRATRPGPVA